MVGSEGVLVLLARANADCRLDVGDEDLAVADLTGSGRRDDCVDHFVDKLGVDRDLDLQLRQKTDRVFRPSINLGVTFWRP